MKMNKFTTALLQLSLLSLSLLMPNVHAQSGDIAIDKFSDLSQQLHVALFGRAANPAGLAWIAKDLYAIDAPTNIVDFNRAYDTNYRVRDLVESYGSSLEFREVNAGGNDSFVKYLYLTLFNREPEQNGYTYWKSLIDNGNLTRAHAAISIMAASHGNVDGDIVINKVRIATEITRELDLAYEVNTYQHAIYTKYARKMLATLNDPTQARGAIATMINFYGAR